VPVLWEFAWVYADFVLQPDNLSIARLIIGEAERVPEISRQYHETGPARALEGIAIYLEEQRLTGRLKFDDATLAAEDLWSLILSGPRNHALHFPHDSPDEAVLRRSITNGLQVFLRAYSSQPNADLASLAELGRNSPSRRIE